MRFASSLRSPFRAVPALLVSGALLVLVGGLSAAPADAQTFAFASGSYSSPTFTGSSGDYNFTSLGTSNSVTLVTGVAQSVVIDLGLSKNTNNNNADVSTGTATYNFTLGGMTQTLSQGYSYRGDGTLTYQTGSTVLFNVGNSQISVTAGPAAVGNGVFRGATLLLLPAAVTAVPEPGEWATMGMAGAGLCGLMVRARRKKAGQSASVAA